MTMLTDSIRSAMNMKKCDAPEAELSEDVLTINCRKCSTVPDCRSPVCLRCIVSHISEEGCAGRIRLRTSRDLELFGPAAEALCEIASLYRSASPGAAPAGRSCSDCDNSCRKVMELAWAGFPDPKFDSARGRLVSFHPADGRCSGCIQKTYRALDQAELGMDNLKKRISVEAARAGGA